MTDNNALSRRDFEHLSAAVQKLTATLENFPSVMAATYVRHDVYEADQRAHKQTHVDQRQDIDGLTKARDWVVKIFLAAVFVALISLVVVGR